MKIGGLNVFSLSDFPGHISAVVFAQSCNFRCPFCHNGSLIPLEPSDGKLISEASIFQFLESRRDKLNGVVVSGGEPTIQPDLADFVGRIKTMGFAVKLDTNGSRPDVIKALLQKELIDYIAMDIKAPLEVYDRLTGVHTPIQQLKETIELIINWGIPHEFRTTVVEPLLSAEDVQAIQAIIPPDSHHHLQIFQPENAFDPALRNYIAADPFQDA